MLYLQNEANRAVGEIYRLYELSFSIRRCSKAKIGRSGWSRLKDRKILHFPIELDFLNSFGCRQVY